MTSLLRPRDREGLRRLLVLGTAVQRPALCGHRRGVGADQVGLRHDDSGGARGVGGCAGSHGCRLTPAAAVSRLAKAPLRRGKGARGEIAPYARCGVARLSRAWDSHPRSTPEVASMLMTGSGPIDAERAFTQVARSRRRAALARRLRREPAGRRPASRIRRAGAAAFGRTRTRHPRDSAGSDQRHARAQQGHAVRPLLPSRRGRPPPLAAALAGRAPRRRPAADLRRRGGRRVRRARRPPPCLGGEGAWGPDDRRDRRHGSAGVGSA